jgi:outer membrane receptor for ferrienterochelin and colicins
MITFRRGRLATRGMTSALTRCALGAAIVVGLAGAVPAFAQPVTGTPPTGTPPTGAPSTVAPRVISGVVLSATDSAPVALAVVRHPASGVQVRTGIRGDFRLWVETGDTITVRALGFATRRQVIGSEAALTVRLTPLATVLPVFTTTVGQQQQRANASPRSVTVLDREEIDAVAAVSANQLLRQVPGLQELPAPPSTTSIAIRGFDNSRVLVLVDGEPVAGSLIESRDIGRLSTIAAERIEVTKGPSSVEFGSDALGGVINIIQAAPTEQLTVEADARQGGLGRQESSVGVSQRLGRFGYRLHGGWRQSDRVTGYDAAGATFNRIYDLRSDLRYALPGTWRLRLNLQGSQERQRFPVDASFNGFIDNRGGQGFLEARGVVAGGQLVARAFQQRFEYEYRQSRGLLPIRGSADSLAQQERQGRYLLSYSRPIGAHTVDAGVQRSVRTLVAPEKVDGDSANETVTEAFLRDSWTVGPVLLSVGARHTSSTLWGESSNPSVGAAWQVAPSVRVRSNVARGFRAPGFKEIRFTFSNPAGGYTLAGNPDLEPELSWSSSLGATWAPTATLSVDVEAYRNDVSNLIDWRFEGNNAAGFQQYRNVNVARARTQGVESNIRVTVAGAALSVGYDFLRARNLNTGQPLSRRATHTARARMARVWSVREGLATDLSVRYTGNAPLVGIPSGAPITGPFSTESGVIGTQGALLSVDAQARLQLVSGAELSVGVNNLLGQLPTLWTPAFARQFYAGVRLRWAQEP